MNQSWNSLLKILQVFWDFLNQIYCCLTFRRGWGIFNQSSYLWTICIFLAAGSVLYLTAHFLHSCQSCPILGSFQLSGWELFICEQQCSLVSLHSTAFQHITTCKRKDTDSGWQSFEMYGFGYGFNSVLCPLFLPPCHSPTSPLIYAVFPYCKDLFPTWKFWCILDAQYMIINLLK